MEKIYDEYYYKIYNWALKKTNNKEDAEDLTSNVFLVVFEYFNKNIKVEKIENLIWKIAYNIWCAKAKVYIKEKNNILYDENSISNNEVEMLDKIIYKEIVNDLDHIGLTQNELISFKMYYINDLSIKEISESLETKTANIKYYLYCARNKIKEKYYE